MPDTSPQQYPGKFKRLAWSSKHQSFHGSCLQGAIVSPRKARATVILNPNTCSQHAQKGKNCSVCRVQSMSAHFLFRVLFDGADFDKNTSTTTACGTSKTANKAAKESAKMMRMHSEAEMCAYVSERGLSFSMRRSKGSMMSSRQHRQLHEILVSIGSLSFRGYFCHVTMSVKHSEVSCDREEKLLCTSLRRNAHFYSMDLPAFAKCDCDPPFVFSTCQIVCTNLVCMIAPSHACLRTCGYVMCSA